MMENRRQSNLEMLRIVSMLLIVMAHCDEIFGLASLYSRSLGINKIITDWLHIGGQIGVGCFILISGYFMVEQRVSARKLLKLAGEVWFYTISIWLVWTLWTILQGQIDADEFITATKKALFPILSSHYWFVTAYIILMALSPFFNIFIHSLNQQQYRAFLGTLLTVFVVIGGGIPSVLPYMMEGRLIPVFIMYFIAGYIRRFGNLNVRNASRHFVIAFIGYALLLASFYFITYLGLKFNSRTIMDQRYFYRALNSPLVVVICIELFTGFLKLDMGNHKWINTLASCTLGVYLLHCNSILKEGLTKVFSIYRESRPPFVFLYSLVSVAIIYAAASLIDYIRQKFVEKRWMAFLDRHLGPFEANVRKTVMRAWAFLEGAMKKYYKM